LAAEAAGKASTGLQKALTGDIYTKRWTEIVGKGKKAKLVEKELRVNPVGIGLGAAALATAAVGAGIAVWVLQLKLSPNLVQEYYTKVDSEAYKVIDMAAWEESVNDKYIPEHTVENTVTGYRCPVHGSYISSSEGSTAINHFFASHKYCGVVTEYGSITFPGYYTLKTIFHPEESHIVPAVTHQEPAYNADGTLKMKKKFSVEQRRGFSAGDVLEETANAVGLGAPLAASRVIPKIIMDPWHVFKGKWW